MKKVLSIKDIVAIGIGSALFIILGRFVCIPTGIPNTEIQTAYALLAFMAVLFGPIVGGAIGFIGHSLKDLMTYGSPWFSWVIASAVVGIVIGLCAKKLDIENTGFNDKKLFIFNAFQIAANAIAWGLVAPTLDIMIYAEPKDKVYLQGAVAGITNAITVAVLGTLLIYAYSKTRIEKGSLVEETERQTDELNEENK